MQAEKQAFEKDGLNTTLSHSSKKSKIMMRKLRLQKKVKNKNTFLKILFLCQIDLPPLLPDDNTVVVNQFFIVSNMRFLLASSISYFSFNFQIKKNNLENISLQYFLKFPDNGP